MWAGGRPKSVGTVVSSPRAYWQSIREWVWPGCARYTMVADVASMSRISIVDVVVNLAMICGTRRYTCRGDPTARRTRIRDGVRPLATAERPTSNSVAGSSSTSVAAVYSRRRVS